MEISDEVVEVAARVYRDQQSELGYPKWDDLTESGRESRRDYMRKALEAAAPHLMAEAWDHCVDESAALGWMHEAGARDNKARNPYRSAGAGE